MTELDLAEPQGDEVLVEMAACGICHSDRSIADGALPGSGSLPVVLGHEGSGVVVGCGPRVTSVQLGDHVLLSAMAECGRCTTCRTGRSNLCDNSRMGALTAADGSTRMSLGGRPVYQMSGVGMFATRTVAAEPQVVPIPPDIPLDIACLVSCSVGTGVGAAVHAADTRVGDRVAVFGLGGVGLNAIQGARPAGASRIIGVDTNADRRALGAVFGMTDFVRAGDGVDIVARIRELVPGGVDIALEATGHTDLVGLAVAATQASWGRTVMLSVPTDPSVSVDARHLLAGRSLLGSIYGGLRVRTDTPRLLEWYRRGLLDLESLVTHRLPLQDINDGFELLRSGGTVRAVVTF